ncbi:DNA-binding protein Alba [Geoglobus sp.]
MAEEAVVFVGSKPVMNYVLATLTQLNEGASKVVIKARGKAISRAVDVAEIVRNRFMPNVRLGSIKIDTEELESEQGRIVNVSTIEIELVKE